MRTSRETEPHEITYFRSLATARFRSSNCPNSFFNSRVFQHPSLVALALIRVRPSIYLYFVENSAGRSPLRALIISSVPNCLPTFTPKSRWRNRFS